MALPDFGGDLLAFIDSQFGSLTSGVNLFRAQMPQTVIEGVLLTETGGERSSHPLRQVVLTVQLTARYRDYTTAVNMARSLYDLLDMPSATRAMGSSKVVYSKAMQPPFSLGQDERQAWRVVFNVECHVVL